MKKQTFALPLILLVGCVLGVGCQKTDATLPGDAAGTKPPVASNAPTPSPPETPLPPTTPTPLKDALTTLFAQEAEAAKSPFPKGTHLLSVDLKDKRATVDVSKEFNGLANKGESTEGLALRKLCGALAPFANVETMRLTVEGKDYDSQAFDSRSVPVRAEQATAGDNGKIQSAGSLDR